MRFGSHKNWSCCKFSFSLLLLDGTTFFVVVVLFCTLNREAEISLVGLTHLNENRLAVSDEMRTTWDSSWCGIAHRIVSILSSCPIFLRQFPNDCPSSLLGISQGNKMH